MHAALAAEAPAEGARPAGQAVAVAEPAGQKAPAGQGVTTLATHVWPAGQATHTALRTELPLVKPSSTGFDHVL